MLPLCTTNLKKQKIILREINFLEKSENSVKLHLFHEIFLKNQQQHSVKT